jgi:osmotically-inducible protein OsmY
MPIDSTLERARKVWNTTEEVLVVVSTDQRIKQNVEKSINRDGRIEASGLTVEVTDGVVSLTGTVPTYTAMWAAYDDALLTNHVVRVVNVMKVLFPPTYPVPADDEIETAAEAVLAWNADLDSSSLKASVESGVVTVEGYVPWYWHRAKAEELVSALRGVTEVRNKVTVAPTPEIEDDLIAKDISDELERARLLDDSKVHVDVKDGVVTLTGKVGVTLSSWRAERTARTALGVRDVKNELSVKYL